MSISAALEVAKDIENMFSESHISLNCEGCGAQIVRVGLCVYCGRRHNHRVRGADPKLVVKPRMILQ